MKRLFTILAAAAIMSAGCKSNQNGTDTAMQDGDLSDTLQTTQSKQDSINKNMNTDTFNQQAAEANLYANLPEEPIFDIKTTEGTLKICLYADTPKHRENFIKLAKQHYYDSILFHRIINGFMIQVGDPLTRDSSQISMWGTGGPGYTIPAEILPNHQHKKGALAAARLGDRVNPAKASSGSQFYIVQDETGCSHLDGEYTVFGEVIQGLEVIDKIAAVKVDGAGRPARKVEIISITPDNE